MHYRVDVQMLVYRETRMRGLNAPPVVEPAMLLWWGYESLTLARAQALIPPRSTSPQLSPQQQLARAPRRVLPAFSQLQLGETSSPCPPSSCACDQHVSLPAIHVIEEHLLLPRLAALTTFALSRLDQEMACRTRSRRFQ
jgi:hypothetical protein